MVFGMPVQSFSGSYADDRGVEPLVWQFVPTTGDVGHARSFFIRTVIRGMLVTGGAFDGLEPDDAHAAAAALPLLNETDDKYACVLYRCVLHADLPCAAEIDGDRRSAIVRFTVDLRADRPPLNQHFAVHLDGTTYEVDVDGGLDEGLARLAAAFPPNIHLICCHTCQFAGYSPYIGYDMVGINCHREARTRYLAVRSKRDYTPDLITEEVPENYLCPEYRFRIPGTGFGV
ncbi:DUF6304 family protein [Nocardia sp. NPDC046473]|uniref:DUF6304 family protein n=1 Tax=Nocardia sp. NPDC046473 TaxID=3155733 RepID=UPI003401183A